MLRRKKTKKPAAIPYWLAAEETSCTACQHRHAVAVTIHCVMCDRPMCPICAVHVRRETFCPQCSEERSS